MNPLWMILASLAGVAALGGIFAAQAALRGRRAARRRLLRESGRLGPIEVVPSEGRVLTRESLLHPNRTLNVRGWDDSPDSGSGVDDIADGTPESSDPFVADPLVVDREFLSRRGSRD